MLSVKTISVHYKVKNGLNDQSALFFDNNFKSIVNSQGFFPSGLSHVNNTDTVPEIIKWKQAFLRIILVLFDSHFNGFSSESMN